MGVVAAGVHDPGALGCVGDGLLVPDGQGVGVCPQDNLFPRPPPALDGPKYAGSAHPACGDADGGQLLLDTPGGLKLLHTKLRVTVEPAAQGYDVISVLVNQRMDCHIASPQVYDLFPPPSSRAGTVFKTRECRCPGRYLGWPGLSHQTGRRPVPFCIPHCPNRRCGRQ